jgi:AAA15 family ATPase/GTPase
MVSYLQNKIINESLLYYPSSQPAIVFERNENETWKDIRFGGKYKGGKRRIPFFDNNAYLSKAGNSADAPEMIREVYNYFRKEMLQLNVDERARKLNWVEDETLLKKVSALLRLVDTGIAGIEVKELEKVNSINLPEGIPEEFKEAILKDIRKKFLFTHISEEGKEVAFNERKESAGTRKLFHLAPLILDALKGGAILIIDELDNSMHPFMAELIIKLFNDPRVNKNNAQLIFSTHNINLMTSKSLRRDQIWFTEKKDGSTTFYSLDDFDKNKVKPQSPFNQWYAEGRFGAVPMIDYNSIVELLSEDGD